jgi:rhodanese-related sulfurtransferase
MKQILLLFFSILTATTALSQKSLKLLLDASNNESVPYISSEELRILQLKDSIVILDAREMKEYNVSHIASAKYAGYDNFSIEEISAQINDKNIPIVVYCSLGIRSEDIGEKLQKNGFSNVMNLYGGIFEWKNNAFPVIDSTGKETENVHAYSRFWGRWLLKGKKVY